MNKKLVIFPAMAVLFLVGTAFADPQDVEMAQVQAIMDKSHQIQSQQRIQEAQAKAGAHYVVNMLKEGEDHAQQQLVTPDEAPAVTTNFVKPATLTPADESAQVTVQALQTQLAQVNQANLLFQQQVNQRIETLNQDFSLVQAKLSQVNQVLGVLNQEITELSSKVSDGKPLKSALTPQQQQQISSTSSILPLSFLNSIEHSKLIEYVLFAIMALLVIVVLMLIPRKRSYQMEAVTQTVGSPTTASDSEENDTKDEYDFMGSDEAIPAKLDLARAYIAMEDYEAAHQVLAQVTSKGNREQQAEAQKMLDRMPASQG